jgi:hypothetical protein
MRHTWDARGPTLLPVVPFPRVHSKRVLACILHVRLILTQRMQTLVHWIRDVAHEATRFAGLQWINLKVNPSDVEILTIPTPFGHDKISQRPGNRCLIG